MNPLLDDFAAQVRAETPGAANVIHLNAAGAGLPLRPVTEAAIAHLHREANVGSTWAAAEILTGLAVTVLPDPRAFGVGRSSTKETHRKQAFRQ